MEIFLPSNDEIEISVFGGGNGFGECILLHLKNDFWAVIDSFNIIHNNERIPVAQHYLQTLYPLDWQTKIKLVVITHWHDDHIKGISSLIKSCTDLKKVSISAALSFDNIKEVLKQEHKFNKTVYKSTSEIFEVFKWGHSNKEKICYVHEFSTFPYLKETIKVQFLSPSSEIVSCAKEHIFDEIYQLLNKEESIFKIIPPKPNIASSAMNVILQDEVVLLGADLENNPSTYPNSGWTRVVKNHTNDFNIPKSFLHKVAHHGSENGHDDSIFSELLHANPIVVLTPYLRGKLENQLPKKEMVDMILAKTSEAYITTKPNWSELQKVNNSYGHIRTRKKGDEVKVEPLNGAIRLEVLMSKV